ncbi:MAG: acetate/propionate family kinase [Gaiellaceae bacterium]
MGAILVVNAGSTSLKLHAVEADAKSTRVESFADAPAGLDAVAHRVVHGGPRFRDPVVIDTEVRDQIRELVALAPLHNAPALEAIDAAQRALPHVPHVAVFDTSFHRTIPAAAAQYAVPRAWREQWGIRRYGFQGLSVEWCAQRVPELLGHSVDRLVVCHLGGGSSVTAVLAGRSVDTTMGFTPLEGVPMTTRSGSIDPGALLYMLREGHLDVDSLDHALNFDSGVKGLAGDSGGMIEVERRAGSGDPEAGLALEVVVHRLAAAVAAMAASAGGLDALAFTAGIGEGSALVRERLCGRLRFLGVELDSERNQNAAPDCDVATERSPVRILVVRAREELVAARAARGLLASDCEPA